MNEIHHDSEHSIISRMIRVRCEILGLKQHLHINKNCIIPLYRVFRFGFYPKIFIHVRMKYYSTFIEPCIRLPRYQHVILVKNRYHFVW